MTLVRFISLLITISSNSISIRKKINEKNVFLGLHKIYKEIFTEIWYLENEMKFLLSILYDTNFMNPIFIQTWNLITFVKIYCIGFWKPTWRRKKKLNEKKAFPTVTLKLLSRISHIFVKMWSRNCVRKNSETWTVVLETSTYQLRF